MTLEDMEYRIDDVFMMFLSSLQPESLSLSPMTFTIWTRAA